MSKSIPEPVIRDLGQVDFESTWQDMQDFTQSRDDDTPDEIWFLEHDPIFTLGMNGKREHVLAPGDIPLLDIDRGGQVTYHGPGQLVVYPLVNLRRQKLGVRDLVDAMERSVVDCLADFDIKAAPKPDAPGVYTEDGAKIASLGIRVRRGCSYHGLAFNVNMDLEPFDRINPCGYEGLQMTQVVDRGGPADLQAIRSALEPHLKRHLRYN
ncbi:MAG: lipoyl(octanoyl) transferase LipB [Gammaproteobacteria bacterium]|nr:lipoyl(octanoyl) transferase LipB [Gammaproteobacteria bacterium]